MRIAVCVKSVVKKEPKAVQGSRVPRNPEDCVLNPFDRPALSLARSLAGEAGDVVVVSMGPPAAREALYEALAAGADRGVLVSDPALAGSDTLATSRALAAALGKLAPLDLVMFGARSSDSDTGHVGPQTAEILDLPLCTWTREAALEEDGRSLAVVREADGFREVASLPLPAALTVHHQARPPEDTALTGIQEAFSRKPVETWTLADLSLNPARTGEPGSPTTVLSMARAERTRKCEFLTGDTQAQAVELARRLKDKGLL